MPRVSDVYTIPAGTEGEEDTTISSTKYNNFVHDVELDLNTPRPILAGGSGATNAAAARTNLQVERANATVTNYDTHVFETGSFYSAVGATAAPTAGVAYTGIAHIINNDPNLILLQARDLTTGARWTRRRTGAWNAWVIDSDDKVNVSGDTMTGALVVSVGGSIFNGPSISVLSVVADTDAHIMIRRTSASSWSGWGSGTGGEMWFRSGLTAVAPQMWLDGYALSLLNAPTADRHAVNKLYSDATLLAARQALEQQISELHARIAALEQRLP